MLEHRFRDHLTPAVAPLRGGAAVATATDPAFLPCPLPTAYSPSQLACVAEVYRLAREMAEAQVRAARRVFPPAFSLN